MFWDYKNRSTLVGALSVRLVSSFESNSDTFILAILRITWVGLNLNEIVFKLITSL